MPNEGYSDRLREGRKLIADAISCEERGESDGDLVVALYTMGKTELLKAAASAQHVIDLNRRREIANTVKMANERIASIMNSRLEHLSLEPQDPSATRAWRSSKRGVNASTSNSNRKSMERRSRSREQRYHTNQPWEHTLRSSAPSSPTKSSSNSRVAGAGGNPSNLRGAPRDPGSKNAAEADLPSGGANFESYIESAIVEGSTAISFADVIGQEKAKDSLKETVIYPMLRPELFRGLRAPSSGLLLFGPPGNGKTLLVKALATEAKCTLFSITAATLTSKYVGEGEKLVRTMFETARKKAPSIVFIDEIDSILTSRKSDERESSRRMKTEFFAAFDGVRAGGKDNKTDKSSRVLVIGATNRPEELDSAAIRRFTKRIYVPMPDMGSRKTLLAKLLSEHGNPLSISDIALVAKATRGYSGSDLTNLARDAALGPIREIDPGRLLTLQSSEVRRIGLDDFRTALAKVRISVSAQDVAKYEEWNTRFGDVS